MFLFAESTRAYKYIRLVEKTMNLYSCTCSSGGGAGTSSSLHRGAVFVFKSHVTAAAAARRWRRRNEIFSEHFLRLKMSHQQSCILCSWLTILCFFKCQLHSTSCVTLLNRIYALKLRSSLHTTTVYRYKGT